MDNAQGGSVRGFLVKAGIAGLALAWCLYQISPGEGNPPPTTASQPGASQPATTQAGVVTEQAFLNVLKRSCRCHPQCASVAGQVKIRWIVPGNPESSPTYTAIGKTRQAGGKYHTIPAADKQLVFDFIKQMKPN